MRWRRHKLSRLELLGLALVGISFYALAWWTQEGGSALSGGPEWAAAQQTMAAFDAIRMKASGTAFKGGDADPSNRGELLGLEFSPITSVEDPSYLSAKLTSINPNFAAVLVKLLRRAGVREGDTVAMGMSGSFPALNIAALIACQTLGARAIVVTSLSASSWGANDPQWTWLDMESHLYRQDLLRFRSQVASLGGEDDQGGGLPQVGKRLLREAIERNGIPLLEEETLEKSVDNRWRIYWEAARSRIKVYVNIGGGVASLGDPKVRDLLRPGLNRSVPAGSNLQTQGIALRFLQQGVPVIHLEEVEELATRYGLPVAPASIPAPGTESGELFRNRRFHRGIVGILLGLYLILLVAVRHLEWRGPSEEEF